MNHCSTLAILQLSLENKIEFSTKSGIVGKVVAPAAWMFHKGLTFPRRQSKLKIYKDLYGIWYVSTQLEEFSEQAVDDLKLLSKQSVKWFKTFQNNLQHWIQDAVPLDWINLESQEPNGKLKKLQFESVVNSLIN